MLIYLCDPDREEVTKEGDFTLNDEDEEEDDEQEEWDGEAAWANDGDDGEGDVKDESAAYLDFLNEEVPLIHVDYLAIYSSRNQGSKIYRRGQRRR